jgi:hypothetical protein
MPGDYRKGKKYRLLIAAMVFAIAGAGLAFAQIDTGSITGTVRDTSGAVVPGAEVTATNSATKVTITSVTNSSGVYQFLALIPGTYSVKVSASGFSPQVQNDLVVHVQSKLEANFALAIGQIQQEAIVTASEPLLQTQSANVGGVVEGQQIRDLPLNGRRYADLALLEPGVRVNPGVANPAVDRFSANGNLDTQNYFSLDGVDNNSGSTNLQEGSVQVVQPPPDALQEFRVQTRTYSAEFGTSAGAVVNASIRSGTNEYHGSAFEFLRNNVFDANTFFNNKNGVPKGQFKHNQFGGTFGGPIIKNKTFFFADYQGFMSRKFTTINSTVPTPLMKTGNFTEYTKALTDSVVPVQKGCISGSVIKSSCIDPVAQKLFALFPDPNIPGMTPGTPGSWKGSANYQFPYSVPNNTHSIDARVDHTLNSKNQLMARYSYFRVNRQDPPWAPDPVAGNGNFATQYILRGQSVALAWTDTLNPSLLNQLHLGFNRMYAHSDPIGLELGKSLNSQFGLTGIPEVPASAGVPPINISGFTRLGSSPWRPQYQISQVWQLLENLSWLKKTHSVQFGYEFHRQAVNFLDTRAPQGELSSSGIYSGVSGFGPADFLLGNINESRYTTPTVAHNYVDGHSFYGQDTWKVTNDLTLTYGLRYELFTPVLNRQNQMSNFSPDGGGKIVPAASNASGAYDRSLIHPDRNDFAPRLGVAYHVAGPLVLRGGYGVFYQHVNRIGSESMLALNPPFVVDGDLVQNLGSTTPVFQLKNGFPIGLYTPASVDLTRLQIRAQDPNQRTGYVQQASFGPEIQVMRNTVLSVNWVGNWGRKMNRLRNANQGVVLGYDSSGNALVGFPYANLNTVLWSPKGIGQHAFLEYATNDGNTSYNALGASLRRSFSKNIGFQISYTWSHGISDYVDNLTGGSTPANAYNYLLERSNSPFDVRHVFVANGIWALPIGAGHRYLADQGMFSKLIGGWQVNTIVTLKTGLPFTVSAPDNSFTGGSHANRANQIGDPFAGASTDPSAIVTGGSGFFINPAAFGPAAVGTFGTLAPRVFHGPGWENVDFSIFKSFRFTETRRIEFRAEFFNAFNHPNFGNPGASITSLGSFGKVSSTVGDPRDIQFALKIYF